MKTSDDALREQLAILYAAISIEDFGVEFYTRLSECVRGEEGKALMRGLARDEKGHKKLIQDEVSRIIVGRDVQGVKADARYADIVPDKIFPFVAKDRCLTVKEEIEALEIGIEVERKSIKMYKEGAEKAFDAEIKQRFDQLAGIEDGHLKLLLD